MINVKHNGDFKNTERFLSGAQKLDYERILASYGRAGVSALSAATPVDTGEAANAWGYAISKNGNVISLMWTNSKMAGNVPLVILIQMGHATGTGGYVRGLDFINPALRPIFDQIANDAWKEVTGL